MTREQTLSIIKPDAVKDNNIGAVITLLENGGLKVVAVRMLFLSNEQAQAFYSVHKARPFFDELVVYMTSGPVLVMALEGESAIAKNREIMGATNPKEAAPGTIRALFGKSIDKNVVHGSDAPETAKTEIAFFFKVGDINSR